MDIEAAGGYVPMPEITAGGHLLEYFFEMGPASKDGPLSMLEIQKWAPVLIGYDEWPSWEARLFVRLSRDYCVMQHEARDRHCPPPWEWAVPMWRWVQNLQAEKSLDYAEVVISERMKADEEERRAHGNRKRR